MIIKKMALGNRKEAFEINDFTNGVNIVFSDDNNKGKTIVIQSILYSLGNEPSFPTSFNYKEYYHFLEIEHNNQTIYICRKDNQIILQFNGDLYLLQSISEYKNFWNSKIFPLPEIVKDNRVRICDPVLYLQLFSIGQDKKETNNIYHSGYYKKQDFIEMLHSFCRIGDIEINKYSNSKLKRELSDLTKKRDLLLKENKVLKSHEEEIGYLSSLVDKNIFESQIKELDSLRESLSVSKVERNRAAVRRTKLQVALKELKSLNRHISVGEVHCLDCNSTNIGYSLQDDDNYNEEIEKLDSTINEYLEEFNNLISDKSISLESILLYKDDYQNVSEIEKEILELNRKLSELNGKIKENDKHAAILLSKQQDLDNTINTSITEFYNTIDESGTNSSLSVFTKRDEVLSGSEATVFYLSKLLSFATIFDHDFPLIIDSFRAEDLSTEKEKIVLDIFNDLRQQVIITTTTKIEERNKYDAFPYVKQHDFSNYKTKQLLTQDYVNGFKNTLSLFGIDLYKE